MKGGKLHIYVLIPIVMAFGILMAVLNILSWSQGADTENEYMLYGILFAIGYAFVHAYYVHPEKMRKITKKWDIRLKHSHVVTAYAFALVGMFSIWSYETLHLISTALAIGVGYFTLYTYPESKRGKIWAIVGCVFGLGGFFIGFLTHQWSVAWGEVIAAFPLAVQMWITLDED